MPTLGEDYAEIALKLRDDLGLRLCVETGSFHGESTRWAAEHFQNVITIDKWEKHQLVARRQVSEAGFHNVMFHVGDSRDLLPVIVNLLTGPALFFLDAHNLKQNFNPGPDDCPLLVELRAVFKSKWRHAIIIDDVDCFRAPFDPIVWPRTEVIEALAQEAGYGVRYTTKGIVLAPVNALE